MIEQKGFPSKMSEKDQMYGTTVMGARGQIVIPADARKEMGLEPGDKMLVMGKFGKVIALIKADEIENVVGMIIDHAQGAAPTAAVMRDKLMKGASELLKYSTKSK